MTSIAVVVVVGLVLTVAWPVLLQRFRVNPNAQEMESTYIQRNIDATRAAYGLDKLKTEQYKVTDKGEQGALAKEGDTTAQIRLLDPQVVSPTFKQLQQSKQYYTFADTLAVDKYEIDGDVLTLFDDGKKALVFKGTKAEPLPAAEPAAVGEAPATDSVKAVVPAEKLTPAEKK